MRESIIEGVGVIDQVREYRGKKILSLAQKIAGEPLPETITPELAIDAFYSFLFPLPMMKEGGDMFRRQVIGSLLSRGSFWKIKAYTVADPVTSIVAAASFIEKLSKASSAKGGARGEGRGGKEDMEELVERALSEMENEVKTAKDMKRIFSGLAAGKGSVLAFDESIEEVMRLARETDISKVLEKLEGLKIPSQRGKTERSQMGWIEGVELGGDLERLHYSQLALPWIHFLVSFADSKMLLYRKVTTQSFGPIYVLMDKSGSMVGNKIDWARAVAIALLKRAFAESRGFYARFFDSIAYPPVVVRPNSKLSEITSLLSYLARVRAGGGTDISKAILSACEDIAREGKKISDIVLISDGEDRIAPDVVIKALRRANARLHTIMIQGQNLYLKQVSTRYMTVKRLEAKEILKVVDFS